ncbi:DUF2382 domain-containing protein [Pantanalinema rosaneae CENA516]|uniref:DUF2382 domain-containing protein n=1 Tax=Pantanalinema rosaneae TaxID=1620701 RepID=UPI003D6E37AB
MAFYRIKNFDPDYRRHFDNRDLVGYSLYSGNDKIGSVDDLLVDEEGRFRYLVINTGAWIFGKKVLLPIGQSRIDYNAERVFVNGLTREQVEALPEFTNENAVDYDYEERVRNSYRSMATGRGMSQPMATGAYDRNSYRYDRDTALYNLNEQDHQNLRLYEERLIANKHRQKTGEVVVGKRVETERAHVEIPLEKEKVVIERTAPTNADRVAPGEAAFNEGDVVRMEVYEETPDVHKEAFVREQVNVRKVVDRDTVNAEEEIRREELDMDTQGRPVVDRSNQARRDRS